EGRFEEEALAEGGIARVGVIRIEDLDRDDPIQGRLHRFVDLAHSAAADRLEQGESLIQDAVPEWIDDVLLWRGRRDSCLRGLIRRNHPPACLASRPSTP